MNQRQCKALKFFAAAVKELKESGVIRSDRYLGDIGEFLCADAYNIDLATNLREVGHDGHRKELRAQIKYAGGLTTNINFGNPNLYDEIYIVLGRESVVRGYRHEAEFLIYKRTSEEVLAFNTLNKKGYSQGVTYFRGEPDKIISLSEFLD